MSYSDRYSDDVLKLAHDLARQVGAENEIDSLVMYIDDQRVRLAAAERRVEDAYEEGRRRGYRHGVRDAAEIVQEHHEDERRGHVAWDICDCVDILAAIGRLEP